MFYTDGRREMQVGDKVILRGAGATTNSNVLEVDEDSVTFAYWGGTLTLSTVRGGHWTVMRKPDPIPTGKNTVLKINKRIYVRTGSTVSANRWGEVGRSFSYSDAAIQSAADEFGFEVIFEGGE